MDAILFQAADYVGLSLPAFATLLSVLILGASWELTAHMVRTHRTQVAVTKAVNEEIRRCREEANRDD